MSHHLNENSIQDGSDVVFFDGSVIVGSMQRLTQLLEQGVDSKYLFVNSITDDVRQFNALVSNAKKITIKEKLEPIDIRWNFPDEYLDSDIESVLYNLLQKDLVNRSVQDCENRIIRFERELEKYKQLGLLTILKLMHYIISTFIKNDVVWGIGRGSCVSSYILFLLQVHDVDPVLYDLSIDDFLD